MQNNEHPFRTFLRRRGYQLVLVLCALAVGVSGLIFLHELRRSGAKELLEQEVSVSVPVKADPKPEVPQPVSPAELPTSGKTAETILESEASEIPAAATQPEAVKPERVVRPVSGEAGRSYSMDHLSYSETMRDWRTHDGVDLLAAQGTQVRAALDGAVAAIYDDDFLGTVVELQHSGGRKTQYANLTAMPTVQVGDQVEAGQVIGAVGTTALGESAEAPHLHFAYYESGKSADPAKLLG